MAPNVLVIKKSPLALEALALCETAGADVKIATMLQEIFQLTKLLEVHCKTDNAYLVKTLNSTNLVNDCWVRVHVAEVRGNPNWMDYGL